MDWKEKYLNKVTCIDCMEGMKELPNACVDLVVTDPPYEYVSKNPRGGGFMSKENKRHFEKIDSNFGMSFDPSVLLPEFVRICKKFNCYIFTNKNLLRFYLEFAERNKYPFDILLWRKSNPVPTFRGHYLLDKEYVIFIRQKGAIFNSTLGYKTYFTIYDGIVTRNDSEHPTQKPLSFVNKMIEVSSRRGDIIFDPFLGSGTTALAAENLGRQWIGFELNPEYCKIANTRIVKQRQQLSLKLD